MTAVMMTATAVAVAATTTAVATVDPTGM